VVRNLNLGPHLANVFDTRSLVIHRPPPPTSQRDDAAKISLPGQDIVAAGRRI